MPGSSVQSRCDHPATPVGIAAEGRVRFSPALILETIMTTNARFLGLALFGVLVTACDAEPLGLQHRTAGNSVQPLGPAASTLRAGPVTIVTAIDFSGPPPFPATFTVTEGAARLGCSAGTLVDDLVTVAGVIHSGLPPAIRRTYTCTADGAGTITAIFRPKPNPTGSTQHWTIVAGTGDFVNLHGEGEEVLTLGDGGTGSTLVTGDIFYTP